jgi:hypothetical protein
VIAHSPAGSADRRPPWDTARAVVVYEHSLLGEGIARVLASATGAQVLAVPGRDERVLAAVLAAGPHVVLVERGPLLDAVDVAAAAPAARVIDLDPITGGVAATSGAIGRGELVRLVESAFADRLRDEAPFCARLYRISTPRRVGSAVPDSPR